MLKNIFYFQRTVRMTFPEELDDPTITFDGTRCDEDSVSLI